MAISIRQLLEVGPFQNHSIVAGKSGLDGVVQRLSMLEIPIKKLNETIGLDSSTLAQKGDLYFASFLMYGSPKEIEDEIMQLISEKSSGIFVVDYKDGLFNQQTIAMADAHGFPIIGINAPVAFAELIDIVMNLVIQDRTTELNRSIMSRILNCDLSEKETRTLLHQLYPFIKDTIVALNITRKGGGLLANLFWPIDEHVVVPQSEESLLIILSADTSGKTYFDGQISQLETYLLSQYRDFHIGVSSPYHKMEIKKAVDEAQFANKTGRGSKKTLCRYEKIGSEQWIRKLLSDDDFVRYAKGILEPIAMYEEKNNIELMPVVHAFVKNEGNFKMTAESLFMHENTIRYRIEKVKKILSLSNRQITLHTALSMATCYDNLTRLG